MSTFVSRIHHTLLGEAGVDDIDTWKMHVLLDMQYIGYLG